MAINTKYKCNCPDFARVREALPYGQTEYQQLDHDWSSSNAGVKSGFPCKHIWNLMILKGEVSEDMIPSDYPINSDAMLLDSYRQGWTGGQDERRYFAPLKPKRV